MPSLSQRCIILNLRRIGAVVNKKYGKKYTNVNIHYTSCLALPWGQNFYPEDNEIHNFSRSFPALYHHAFCFSYIQVVSEKKIFFKISLFWHFLPRPQGPRGAGNPKFTIYPRLVPKMHHIKFEKNWSSGYQEVKNVQMWTDTTHHVWPRPGGKTSTLRIMKFTISEEVFLLYIAMRLVFLKYM